jgi:hypothetical protein
MSCAEVSSTSGFIIGEENMQQKALFVFNTFLTASIALYLLYMFLVAKTFPLVSMVVLVIVLTILLSIQLLFFKYPSVEQSKKHTLSNMLRGSSVYGIIGILLISLYNYVMQAGIRWETLIGMLISALVFGFISLVLRFRS